jgi:oxygen-independent coproporphyrinogen III oxidase
MITTDNMSTDLGPSRERAGIYIHVPFCRRRCPYCDFYFEIRPADERFAHGVVEEFKARRDEFVAGAGPAQQLRFTTIAFGGGTPSSLPAADIATILHSLPRDVDEISLEANPEDIVEDTAKKWRDAGVTRVSIGMQSFDDDVLSYLGRAHDGEKARVAVERVVKEIPHVGIDLIVGVPGERAARVDDDVAIARALGVGHVSAYLLTVEEGTPLVQLIKKGARKDVDDDAQADAYERVQVACGVNGYAQYEISNHAKAGEESRHNRLYWAHCPYLGVGPGAHSMGVLDDGAVVRRHNRARFDDWIVSPRSAPFEQERLDPPHALREGIAFGLRDLSSGVDLDRLEALHHSSTPDDVVVTLDRAIDRGEVVRAGRVFRLTSTGARFSDRVARAVLG